MKRNHAIILLLLFVIIKVFIVLWNETGPFIANDEYIYKNNAYLLFQMQGYDNFHYPPLYSILLFPSFLCKNWYSVILVLNAMMSCLVVPATWLLAHSSGVNKPGIPAFLSALIPFHIVYPNYILSENIFVPFFILSFALAMRGFKGKYIEAVCLGVVLAMSHLSKYMFLPALPLFFLVWIVSIFLSKNKKFSLNDLIKSLIPIFVYLSVFSIWLLYGVKSGHAVSDLLGLNISTAGKIFTNTISTLEQIQNFSNSRLYVWILLYFCFIVIKWLPIFAFYISCAFGSQSFPDFKKIHYNTNLFFISSLLLILGYVLISILHSYGAKYNQVVPQKIMGRYLVHLGPLFLVWASLSFQHCSSLLGRVDVKKILPASAGVVILGCVIWWIFVDDGIWEIPSFFYKHEINVIDISFMGMGGYLLCVVMSCLIPLVCKKISYKNESFFSVPLAIYLTLLSTGYLRNMPFHHEPLSVKMIVESERLRHSNSEKFCILTENVHISDKLLRGAYVFWGFEQEEIQLIPKSKYRDCPSDKEKSIFLITNKSYNFKEIDSFEYKNKNFVLYEKNW